MLTHTKYGTLYCDIKVGVSTQKKQQAKFNKTGEKSTPLHEGHQREQQHSPTALCGVNFGVKVTTYGHRNTTYKYVHVECVYYGRHVLMCELAVHI